jgi:hypothetical protein
VLRDQKGNKVKPPATQKKVPNNTGFTHGEQPCIRLKIRKRFDQSPIKAEIKFQSDPWTKRKLKHL